MVEKPINPAKLTAVMVKKFVEMGMLEEKGEEYFLTDQGKMLLANFGIEENELY